MFIPHEDYVVAGTKILQRSTGATIGTFSSLTAATFCANMLREGQYSSARWATTGGTTSGDRTIYDALAKV